MSWYSEHQARLQRRRDRLRKRGPVYFVLRAGVLEWALPVFAFVVLFADVLVPVLTGAPVADAAALVSTAKVQLPLWILAGLGLGIWWWRRPAA